VNTLPQATVYLVGSGPGDPELLTRRAYQLLESAELVLHDDLVPDSILQVISAADIVNVGKRCGVKKITQEQINERMIDAARRGLRVVRLKSGDPGIFGRLREEVDALAAAGVSFEIVPGVTAGAAAAAALGVSLTERRFGARLVFVSAHPAHADDPELKTDWKSLARSDSTLVVYMPGHDFSEMQRQLLEAGIDALTPAAIVSRASTPEERRYVTSLAGLHLLPRAEAPALLLIGRALERLLHRSGARAASLALENPGIIFAER
jgi:uroporphyrin-III C-methyltransferase